MNESSHYSKHKKTSAAYFVEDDFFSTHIPIYYNIFSIFTEYST